MRPSRTKVDRPTTRILHPLSDFQPANLVVSAQLLTILSPSELAEPTPVLPAATVMRPPPPTGRTRTLATVEERSTRLSVRVSYPHAADAGR